MFTLKLNMMMLFSFGEWSHGRWV